MAKMSPAKLPQEVRNDPGREAEVTVYDALETQLGDSYSIFYSVEWNAALAAKEAVQDGEADFVVCHPRHGFLVMEVKGGIIGSMRKPSDGRPRAARVASILSPIRSSKRESRVTDWSDAHAR